MSAQCLPIVSTMSSQCLPNFCPMPAQCMCNVCAMSHKSAQYPQVLPNIVRGKISEFFQYVLITIRNFSERKFFATNLV